MHKRFTLQLLAASAALALCGAAAAQSSIKIANIVELSGGGATAGTNFKNGVELAVKEINAAGGILGKKIESSSNDTQSNPGVAKGLTQKAVDNEVFAIFGPVFSGSIMVSMAESRRAEVPNWTVARPHPSPSRATPSSSAPASPRKRPCRRWRSTSSPSPRTWRSCT